MHVGLKEALNSLIELFLLSIVFVVGVGVSSIYLAGHDILIFIAP